MRKPRRWLPIVAGVVTFLLVLVTVGVVVGDVFARNVEMRSLVARIEASESAMGALQEDVQGIFAEYEGRTPLSDEDQAALDEKLKAAAAAGRDAIAAAGQDVEAMRWLVWHREIGAAQDAYLAHNRAWQDYLGRAAQDPAEFARPQDDVNSTFEDAERYVRASLPGSRCSTWMIGSTRSSRRRPLRTGRRRRRSACATATGVAQPPASPCRCA